MSSFSEKIKQQEEEAQKEGIAQSGGDWYKFSEGINRFRVLAEPVMIFEKYKVGICYTDCGYQGSAKFLTFVLDKKDNKIKLAKLPYGIGTTIGNYEKDEDFHFEGFPMPYDLKVGAVGAGTKEVEYTVTPSPATEIPESVLEDLKKKSSIANIVQKMKDNKKEEHIKDGTWQKNQDAKAKLKEELDAHRTGEKNTKVGNTDIEYPESNGEPNFDVQEETVE